MVKPEPCRPRKYDFKRKVGDKTLIRCAVKEGRKVLTHTLKLSSTKVLNSILSWERGKIMATDEKKLITIENYPMDEIWQKFIMAGAKESYTHDELFSVFVPVYAIFERVPLKDAFGFLANTENMALWTMSMRNLRLVRDDIYEGDEAATPTGKVFIRTVANEAANTIEWYAGHESPDGMWIYYQGMLADGQIALGRDCTTFFWTNFVHERVRKDRMLVMGFKLMRSAHMIEINNMKMILEEKYGGKS